MKLFLRQNREIILWTLLLCIMVFVAEITGEREFIFPEAAALALGMWVKPKKPWNVSNKMMIFVMTLSAICGVLIVRYIPGNLMLKCAIGIVCTCAILAISGTTLVPLISACILPIFLNTSSWLYPCCVFVLVTVIVLIRIVLEKKGIREKSDEAEKIDFKDRIFYWIKTIIMLEIVCLPATVLNKPYLAAPPIIVMATEMFMPESKLRTRSLNVWTVMILSATIGTAFRLLNILWSVPLTICVLLAVVLDFIFLKKADLMLPPAAAACVLAMLINGDAIWQYPVLLGIGAAFMIICIHIAYKIKTSQFADIQKTD